MRTHRRAQGIGGRIDCEAPLSIAKLKRRSEREAESERDRTNMKKVFCGDVMGSAHVVGEGKGRHIKRLITVESVLFCKTKFARALDFGLIIDASLVLKNDLRRV